MRLVSAHAGRLITVEAPSDDGTSRPNGLFSATGLPVWDALLPPTGLARGVMHEVLYRPGHPIPAFFALLLARMTRAGEPETRNPKPETRFHPAAFALDSDFRFPISSFPLVWLDPDGTLYPPAVFAAGIEPKDLWLLRPRDADDLLWSTAECLRCRGVSATIAPLPVNRPLDRRDARRLQLAVERGGGAGLLLRVLNRHADVYAAATRWLVEPAPGARFIQRWKITLIHGHGGRIGNGFLLEHCRDPFENHPVRAIAELDRGSGAATARAG